MIGYAYEWWKGIRHFPYLDITLDPRGLFMKGFTDVAQWSYEPWLVVGTRLVQGRPEPRW